MKNRSDKKTASCFDLIFPTIGELVGGSMRENKVKVLQTKAQKVGIDPQKIA
jgi:asparaginyl-tRNA synthetase